MTLSVINNQTLKWVIIIVIGSILLVECTGESYNIELLGNLLLLAGQILVVLTLDID